MKRPPRPILFGGAALLLAFSAVKSPFWASTARVLAPGKPSYRAWRNAIGFGGIPMDAIVARLDRSLDPDRPIGFGPGIEADDFLRQRFTEALYPRRIDARSPDRIDLVPADDGTAAKVLGSARYRGVDALVELAPPRPDSPARRPPPAPLELSWIPWLGSCASLLGIGLLAAKAIPSADRPSGTRGIVLAVMAWALLLAASAGAATVLEVPIPWIVPAAAGSFLLAGIILFGRLRRGRPNGSPPFRLSPGAPESLLMAAVLVLFAARVARFPIVGWDGRSIWMFKAKQLFVHGMIPRNELASPSLQFSRPGYPLMFPACSAFFTSLAGSYDERMASMALPVLLAAFAAGAWTLSRDRLGRWAGAAFCGFVFFSLEHSVGAGYVDGLLCLLIVVEFLAFRDPGSAPIAWCAAAAASLLKREGLILAGVTAAACVAAFRSPRRGSLRARLLPFLLFLPAAGYAVWTDAAGAENAFSAIRWRDVFAGAGERGSIVLQGTAAVVRNGAINSVVGSPVAAEGLAGALLAIAVLVLRRHRPDRTTLLALVLGAAFAAFALGTLFVTPQDLRWHVGTALARLLMLPSVFFVLAALTAAAGPGQEEVRA